MIRQNNSNRMNHRTRSNTPRNASEGDNRGRGNTSVRSSYEQNSNNGRVRGNPRQLREKYLTLAQEAISAGNIIDAETYYQYADHYYRLTREEFGQSQPPKSTSPTVEPLSMPAGGEDKEGSDLDQPPLDVK
ncbi:MAG: DUF4167 domain-containing protein [Alphaproteobacteria bacterium]|nr:DUF4167 domain-containing protein [Alphaproteobacteria bacterium]